MEQISQPPPALLNISLRHENFEEALGSALVAHQGAFGLGERAGGQHDLRVPSGLMQQMVDHDDVAGAIQTAIDGRPLGAPIEVIFEYDDGLRGALFDRVKGVLQRVPANEAES